MTGIEGDIAVDVRLTASERQAMLVEEARVGLSRSPKDISPIWFHDEQVSALFRAITHLPEHYPTRAERALLERHGDEIATAARAVTLVELASGAFDNEVLLDAMGREGSLRRYAPFDVDEVTLRDAAERLLTRYPNLQVHGVVGDFRQHLPRSDGEEPRLVAFLGGRLGRLMPRDRARFLFDVDAALDHRDRFLLGVDLVKDADRLARTYDDAAGLTAEFNRNALRCLGATLGGDIDPDAFDHVARWDGDEERVEMVLRARQRMTVHLPGIEATVEFADGEELRTQVNAKFTPDGITDELYRSGLLVDRSWQHEAGYLLLLVRPYC